MKTMNWKEVKACSPKQGCHTPLPRFVKDLLCFKECKGEAGGSAQVWGSSAFGVDMPTPRSRQLSEKSGTQPEPGISGSNDLCNCSHVCVMLYTN